MCLGKTDPTLAVWIYIILLGAGAGAVAAEGYRHRCCHLGSFSSEAPKMILNYSFSLDQSLHSCPILSWVFVSCALSLKKRQAKRKCVLVDFVYIKDGKEWQVLLNLSGVCQCVRMSVSRCVLGGSLCGLGDKSGVSPSRLTRT